VLEDEEYWRLRSMYRAGPSGDAIPEKVISHYVKSLSRPGRLTAALNYYRANLASNGGAWEALSAIGPITAPTVLVWGDEDPALGRRAAEATERDGCGGEQMNVCEPARMDSVEGEQLR